MHQRDNVYPVKTTMPLAMSQAEPDRIAQRGSRRPRSKGEDQPRPDQRNFGAEMAGDAEADLALARCAICAARTGRPAFDGIGEIEKIFELALPWRDRTSECTANREIARIRKTPSVVERNPAGCFAENHQAKTRRAFAGRRELSPGRDRLARLALDGRPPPSAQDPIGVGRHALVCWIPHRRPVELRFPA